MKDQTDLTDNSKDVTINNNKDATTENNKYATAYNSKDATTDNSKDATTYSNKNATTENNNDTTAYNSKDATTYNNKDATTDNSKGATTDANKDNILHISVSGRVFEIPKRLLVNYSTTLLGQRVSKYDKDISSEKSKLIDNNINNRELESETAWNKTLNTLYFNRPVSAFKAVLSYYQTGELHMPKNMCPRAFKKELDFWGIESKLLEKCCRFEYLAFEDEYETTSNFQQRMTNTSEGVVEGLDSPSALRRFKAKLWSLLEYKRKTTLEKVVRGILIMAVILSIITVTLETVDLSTQELDTCEILPYLKDVGFQSNVIRMLKNSNCTSLDELEDKLETMRRRNLSRYTLGTIEVDEDEFDDMFEELNKISRLKERHYVLFILDYFLLAFFTLELILRLFSCPSLRQYFLSVLNLVDAVVLFAGYVELTLVEVSDKFRYADKGVKFLYYIQVLRCLRIIRFVKNLRAIRVLSYTVISNIKDLAVLFLYILIGVILFANLVFFLEEKNNFPNIPQSAWWAIITMTTVGYGDVAPKSVGGKLVGSICALTGVLVLALIIPVIANSFISLYQFSHLHEVDEAINGPTINKNQIEPLSLKEKVPNEGTKEHGDKNV